ncbi:BTB POZ domain-containing POB1-like isoform X1, partial [Paramuricea clavata]
NQQIENEASNQSNDQINNEPGDQINNEPGDQINEAGDQIQEGNKIETLKQNESALNKNIEENWNSKHDQSKNSSEISSGENYKVTSYGTEQIIRQHKFHIHSSWLGVQSSYFRSLFSCGMKESSATEIHIQILASEEQAHLKLLEAMYKIDILNTSSANELLEVLRLAHKYDVKFVFKKCKYCLQAAVVSHKICEKIMCFIKVDNTITDVEDLASTLQSFLAKEFSPLDKTWQTTSFQELCEPSIRYLLSSDELATESENTIFHALMYWIKQRGLPHLLECQKIPSLLSVVRFELIPIDYLYNIIQHHSLAKKLPDFNEHYLRGISYHALPDFMKKQLPRQPVKRKASTESFIPYTWVIPRDELDELVGTDESLKSDEFWYCGYRMVLVIKHVVGIPSMRYNLSRHSKSISSATLSLTITDLIEQSEVKIQWKLASQSLTSNYCTEHIFKKHGCTSNVDVEYEMEMKPEESTAYQTKANGCECPFAAEGRNKSGRSLSHKRKKKASRSKSTACLSIQVKMNLV